MALEKQVVSVNFSKGVDTKSDPKQVVSGKLLLLENGVFTSLNRIQKRPGYDGLSKIITGSTSQISSGFTLDTYQDELIMTDGNTLYSRSTSNDTWTSKGSITNVGISTTSVIRNEYQQSSQDSCFHSMGLKCFVWEDSSGGARYTVTNDNTGQQYVSNGLLSATGSVPKCYALGNYIFILMFDTSSNRLRYAYISTLNPTSISSFVDLVVDADVAAVYDAQVINQRLFITYKTNISTINTIWINGFFVVSTEVTIADTATSLSLFGDSSNNVWIIFYNGSKVRAAVYNYNLDVTPVLVVTDVEAVANVFNLTGYHNGTNGVIYYSITGSPTYNYFVRSNTLTVLGVAGTPANLIRSVCIVSKAFTYNSKGYFVVSYDSAVQPTYFVIDNTGLIIAKFSSQSGGGTPAKHIVCNATAISSGVFQLSFLQKSFTSVEAGNIYSFLGVKGLVLDFTQTSTQAAQVANVLHITGGYLWMYDGISPIEHGFHLFPEAPTVSTNTIGGNIAAGIYEYVAVYEWVDNAGNIHRSAPSFVSTITTTGATSTNTITVPTLRLTAKKTPRSPISVTLYRTEANSTIFYRVSSISSLTYNSVTADTVSFTDTLANSVIIGNQQLYTTGGELENIPSPVPLALAIYKNRLMVVDSENRKSFWFSKQVSVGSPVEFNDSFVKNVEERGGDLDSIFPMDDKFIAFKGSNIYFMVGDGPASSGVNDDFSIPQLITSDVGCQDKNSICQSSSGLMFKSLKGIYLLDRSLQTSYVGADVEGYNSSHVTSAQLMQDVNQVRFTTDSGVCLMFDYLVGQWSVFKNIAAVDSAIFQGVFTYLKSDGQVLEEDSSLFTDNGQFISLKIQTSWLKISEVQGYQRVRRMEILGEYISNHRLRLQVAYDYNPYPTQNLYISTSDYAAIPVYGAAATYGSGTPYGGSYPLYQYRVHLSQQKCEALQITLEDTQSSNFGEGYNISALSFEVGLKKGMFKLPATKSFG